jgi:hypothetical protein
MDEGLRDSPTHEDKNKQFNTVLKVLQSAERQTRTIVKNRNTRLVIKNIIAQLIICKRGIFKKHLVYKNIY